MTNPVTFMFEGVAVDLVALELGLGGLAELTGADTAETLYTLLSTSRADPLRDPRILQQELSRLAQDPKIAGVLIQAIYLNQGGWHPTTRRRFGPLDFSFFAKGNGPTHLSAGAGVAQGPKNLPRRAASSVYAQAGESDTVSAMSAEDIKTAVTGLFNQGVTLGREGRVIEAREAYRKIFEVDPHATQREIHVLACLNLGAIYLREKDFDKAAYTLKHAIELDPNRLDARHNYAVALLGLDHSMMAIHQWSIVFARSRAIKEEVRARGVKLEDLPLGLRQIYPRLDAMAEEAMRVLRGLIDFSRARKQYAVSLAALEVLLKHRGEDAEFQRLKTEISAEWVRVPGEESVRQIGRQELKALSRTIAHALRHAPWEYELELDGEGWVLLEQLVAGLNWSPRWVFVTREIIEKVVREVSAKRFEIQGDKIRALYGHSIPGRVLKTPTKPPEILYHGTDQNLLPSIFAEGLRQSGRQYVHLSTTREKALEVARRKGKQPVILTIHAMQAFEAGIQFYTGNDMVWLADEIPPDFFEMEFAQSGRKHDRKGVLFSDTSGSQGVGDGNRGNGSKHVSALHYFPETNSAVLNFTSWGEPRSGNNFDIYDADLKFDTDGQWIGLDLDLSHLRRDFPDMRVLPSAEIVLESAGVFCVLEGNILSIRFKQGVSANNSVKAHVSLDVSQNKITGIEFFFEQFVPDMRRRLAHVIMKNQSVVPPVAFINRVKGCVVGLACGDAVGFPAEMVPREKVVQRYGPGGITHFERRKRFPPGTITDDTQLTMSMANALIETGGGYSSDLVSAVSRHFIAWNKSPDTNRLPGPTCRQGCRNLELGIPWYASGKMHKKGCGSAMRVSPIGIVFANHPNNLDEAAATTTLLTHRDPTAQAAAIVSARLVAFALQSPDIAYFKQHVAEIVLANLPPNAMDAVDAVHRAISAQNLDPQTAFQTIGQGWRTPKGGGFIAEETVAGALYSVLSTDTYQEAVLRAVNAGGDTDSVGAITGAIAGAVYGFDAIPQEWKSAVEKRKELEDMALSLANLSAKMVGVPEKRSLFHDMNWHAYPEIKRALYDPQTSLELFEQFTGAVLERRKHQYGRDMWLDPEARYGGEVELTRAERDLLISKGAKAEEFSPLDSYMDMVRLHQRLLHEARLPLPVRLALGQICGPFMEPSVQDEYITELSKWMLLNHIASPDAEISDAAIAALESVITKKYATWHDGLLTQEWAEEQINAHNSSWMVTLKKFESLSNDQVPAEWQQAYWDFLQGWMTTYDPYLKKFGWTNTLVEWYLTSHAVFLKGQQQTTKTF